MQNFFPHLPVPLEPQVILPTVYVPQSLMDGIIQDALAHPPTETGMAMLGLELTGRNAILLMALIPDLENTVRNPGLFVNGGSDQIQIFKWLNEHWQELRTKNRVPGQIELWQPDGYLPAGDLPKELDVNLVHIGDWHKHPGMFKSLSGTDMNTIYDMITDPKIHRKQVLAPIVTVSGQRLAYIYNGTELVVSTGNQIQVNFHWVSEKIPDRYFDIQPVIVPDDSMPWLPPLPWHLRNLTRVRQELALIADHGWQYRLIERNMDADPTWEIVIAVDSPGWDKRALIITDWDYPRSRPKLLFIPKSQPKPSEVSEKKQNQFMAGIRTFREFIKRVMSLPRYDDLFDTYGTQIPVDSGPYLVHLIEEALQKGEIKDGKQPMGPGTQVSGTGSSETPAHH